MDGPLTPRLLLEPYGPGCVLYRGPLRVSRGDELAEVDGEIQFLWRPSPWTRYVCTFDDGIPPALDPLVPGDVSVEPIGATPVPAGDLLAARDPRDVAAGGSYHSDGLPEGFVFGSPADEVEAVEFHVVNGPDTIPPRSLRSLDGRRRYRGRFELTGKVWRITLDVHPGIDNLGAYIRHLADQNAFGPTHVGRLERADGGMFDATFAREGLELLFTTLSFCRGALTGPGLPMGIAADGSARWLLVKTLLANEWKGRGSWCRGLMGSSIETLFGLFEACWLDELHREIVTKAVRYYVEANSPPPEKGLILGQAALELLSWVVFELQGCNAESGRGGSAAARLRGLLEWAGINLVIDEAAANYDVAGLKSAYEAAAKKSSGDGPVLVTWARNRLVHPERDLPELRGAPLVAAWQLTLFYVELVILRLVDYRGVFSNRLAAQWTGNHEQVPWA